MSVAQGRCAGCGDIRALKQSGWHVLSCPDWAALFQAGKDPPDPAAEYDRWREQDQPAEAAVGLAERVADTQARRRASTARFTRRPDPLEDP